MWPDRVSRPEPLAFETDMLPTALRGPATWYVHDLGNSNEGRLNMFRIH